LRKGLLQVQWNEINKYTQEEITYFLFLEGKSLEAICKIRNINRDVAQKHIIDGKIKYGLLVKSKDEGELLQNVSRAGKSDKLDIINSLEESTKIKLIEYIRKNYVEMYPKEKETAIWIIGELKEKSCMDILIKASVHKFVNVRRMAVSAMGKMEDIALEMPLIRALEDDNPQVVLYAIKALTKVKSLKAKEKISCIFNNSDKDYLKRAAERYMEEIELNSNGR
jgi:hypothetical protein